MSDHRAPRVLRGDNVSAMLVHSLALCIADNPDAHGARVKHDLRLHNGDVARRRVIFPRAALAALVGNALKSSSLDGIISRHPVIHRVARGSADLFMDLDVVKRDDVDPDLHARSMSNMRVGL